MEILQCKYWRKCKYYEPTSTTCNGLLENRDYCGIHRKLEEEDNR